ncbi:MAG: hypothetical protein ACOC0N_06665, partial [Chroococcales cyanobacterium]
MGLEILVKAEKEFYISNTPIIADDGEEIPSLSVKNKNKYDSKWIDVIIGKIKNIFIITDHLVWENE